MDLPQTRKDGLNAATGEYIIFVDGDDWVEPNFIELLYNRAKETGADVTMCDFYWDNSIEIVIYNTAPEGEGENGSRLRDETINRRCPPAVWIRLFRRSLFTENNIIWPKCGMAEDYVISAQTSYYAKKLAHVDKPLHHYRFNANSYCHLESEEMINKKVDGYIKNFKIIQEFMQQNGIATSMAFVLWKLYSRRETAVSSF